MKRLILVLALAMFFVVLGAACRDAVAQTDTVMPALANPDLAMLDWLAARFGFPGALIAIVLYVVRAVKTLKIVIPFRVEGPVEMRIAGHPSCPWRDDHGTCASPDDHANGHK